MSGRVHRPTALRRSPDQLLLQIRGAVAEHERTLIAERTRRGRLYKLQSGQMLPWTRAPYGYRADPDRPRDPAGVRTDPTEAALVAELFRWYADEGRSFMAVVQRLRDLGVRSPSGREYWGMATVRGHPVEPDLHGHDLSQPHPRACGTKFAARPPTPWAGPGTRRYRCSLNSG
jgi:site-specific DNA recombinase